MRGTHGACGTSKIATFPQGMLYKRPAALTVVGDRRFPGRVLQLHRLLNDVGIFQDAALLNMLANTEVGSPRFFGDIFHRFHAVRQGSLFG